MLHILSSLMLMHAPPFLGVHMHHQGDRGITK
jgi:hypothetical protein